MLRIHDTRLKRKIPFEPREPGKIGMYVCGITVYDLCHVGHARSAVAFDVIARYLRKRGFQVKLVKNITDVDDKIIRRAQAEGRTADEVAETYIQAMADDFRALGLAPPDSEPRATQHIDDVIGVVQKLEERGLAYAAGGDVYYAVGSFANYGSLSGQSTDELKSGARIEVGEHKRSPLDFALWKGAKPGEPSWDSPWGPGRPGWHIECSAMCWSQLGETFDLHGGGTDLIFPHHENEIAQSEGAFGPGSFARHWLHNGMVNFGGEKMSKSLGNVVSIRKVAETHDLEALRLLMVSVHYRSPVTFTLGPEENGQATLPRSGRGRVAPGLLLPIARAAGRVPVGAARYAAPGRSPAVRARRPRDRGDGRRLQHRRRHRPPVRRLRAGEQAAGRPQGDAQAAAPGDAGRAPPRSRRRGRSPRHHDPAAVGVPAGPPGPAVRPAEHRPGGDRGADRRSRGGPGRAGLHARG